MDFTLPYALERKLGPTEKLFLEDSYRREAPATVLFVQGPFVIFDQTIFYAESGGQHSDTGFIDGLPLIDVQKKGGRRLVVSHPEVDVPAVTVDTILVHQMAQDAPWQVGDTVSMILDWPRRYNTMRCHSMAHFVYHAARQVYDKPNDPLYIKGCSIDNEGARFDFFGSLDGAVLPEVERIANNLMGQGAAISVQPEPLTPDIQYWRCHSILIPCGGTHVRSATELGPVKLRRSKKGATTTRLAASFV